MMRSHRNTVLGAAAILAFCAAALGGQTRNQTEPAKQKSLPALSAQEIFKRVSPSVMVVESLDAEGKVNKLGSGVVIAAGQVITNRHVVEDGVSFRVEHGHKKWTAKLVKVDPDRDLAELSVGGLEAPAVTVLDSSKLAVGETVYAIGSPEGLELTISEGLISGLREFDKGRVIQTSAAISPGSSGGGLFDAQGRLVGITTFYLKEGQSLNFALPAEWTIALDHRPSRAKPTTKEQGPEFQALVWFELGSSALEAEKYDVAAQAFERAVRLKPDLVWAWNNLSVAYGGTKQYDKALSAAKEAVRLEPDLSSAWASLGLAYGDFGQHEKEVSAYQQAVRLKPTDWIAWENLGAAYGSLDLYDKAASAEQEAIRLKPDNPTAWYSLGLAYHGLGQRPEVIKVYEKLKILDPDMAEEFFMVAVLP